MTDTARPGGPISWSTVLAVAVLIAALGDAGPVLAQAAPAAQGRPAAPAAVGAREDIADVVLWSVDDDRNIRRWGDPEWTGHARLLGVLRDAGLRPRVEHLARGDFADRWEGADPAHLPELIVADRLDVWIRGLESKSRLIRVWSERLSWMTDVASCADFKGRWLFLVAGAPHEVDGRRALDELLKPGRAVPLPGADLPGTAGRAEAVLIAKRAVIAYVSGDPERLRAVASPSSPQLSRCTRPPTLRTGWDVQAGSVEIRGNPAIALARVEMRFRGPSMIGADPVAVVLRREGAHWTALSVGNDPFWLAALPALCRIALLPSVGPQAPPTPRLEHPDDGQPIGRAGRSFAWEIPDGAGPTAAQVCEVLLDEKGASWPMSRIKVYPGEPRSRSLSLDATMRDITGVTSDEMRWCVWSIGADGQVSTSEVRRYLAAGRRP